MEQEEMRCVVRGRVQGVLYRYFAARHARRLALTGYARNLPDFTVEVVAQGHRDNLEAFLERLHKGPFLAKVSNVDVEWRTPTEKFGSFSIVF